MTAPPRDERTLRHPLERPIYAASAAINLGIIVGTVLVAGRVPELLERFPVIGGYVADRLGEFRALAIAAAMAVPTTFVTRNRRYADMTGGAVRLSAVQIPRIHEVLVEHCRALGMTPVPDLFLSDSGIKDDARAFSSRKRDYIVLGTRYLEKDLNDPTLEIVSFQLARELGTLRLGHAAWWNELLVGYVTRIPFLRRPLMRIRAFSRDRYGAHLTPYAVTALLVQASGRRVLRQVDQEVWLRQALERQGFWELIADRVDDRPDASARVRELYKAGLLGLPSGLASGTSVPPARRPR